MGLKNKLAGINQIWQFDNRIHLLLTRILFPDEAINFYQYKGLEFITDHKNGEANGAREILTTEMYKRFLDKISLPKKINVLDLGANNGGFPLLLLSEGFEFNKLVCVEFNPNTFSRMRFNVERNTNCQFYALNAAVSSENKFNRLNLGYGGTSDNIYNSVSENGNNYLIEYKTFDKIYEETFVDETIDLCKIDVEGAEFEIFKSNGFTQIKKCKFLLMEIHHENNRKRSEIIEILKRNSFEEITGQNLTDDVSDHFVHLFKNQKI